MEVQIIQLDRMNLIGFFLCDLLKDNLTIPSLAELARKMKGAVLFNASGMKVTVIFQKDSIKICPGAAGKINATIKGEMNNLLDVAMGANYIRYVLTGKIRISGQIWKLLQLMKIMRKPEK